MVNGPVAALNKRLEDAAQKWRSSHPSARVSLVDIYNMTYGHCDDRPWGTTDGIHWVAWDVKELDQAFRSLGW